MATCSHCSQDVLWPESACEAGSGSRKTRLSNPSAKAALLQTFNKFGRQVIRPRHVQVIENALDSIPFMSWPVTKAFQAMTYLQAHHFPFFLVLSTISNQAFSTPRLPTSLTTAFLWSPCTMISIIPGLRPCACWTLALLAHFFCNSGPMM